MKNENFFCSSETGHILLYNLDSIYTILARTYKENKEKIEKFGLNDKEIQNEEHKW